MSNPLSILFAGESVAARLHDHTEALVFVRALPQRHLDRVLAACEFPHLLIELCVYWRLPDSRPPAPVPPGGIRPPDGYEAVPEGWSDNLTDASFQELHAAAQRLNFQRAVDWGMGQIAAKKQVAPLVQMTLDQMNPVVERVLRPLIERLDRLSSSTPSAPPSSAAPAKTS